MKHLLWNPFKVGSSNIAMMLANRESRTVSNTPSLDLIRRAARDLDVPTIRVYLRWLRTPACPIVFQNAGLKYIDHLLQLSPDNIILRGHTYSPSPHFVSQKIKFDTWITAVRDPYEMYLSAYFQDITMPNYPYYFGSRLDVISAESSTLLDHFLNFDWGENKHVDIDFNFREIKRWTGVDLWEEDFDYYNGFTIIPCKNPSPVRKVVVFGFRAATDTDCLNHTFDCLGILPRKRLNLFSPDIFRPTIKYDNRTEKKWYYEKYKTLQNNLPEEYFKRYLPQHRRVWKKFGRWASKNREQAWDLSRHQETRRRVYHPERI